MSEAMETLMDGPYWRHVGYAALAGVLATVAVLRSPILGSIPPIVLGYVPIDLRLVFLPVTFGITQALAPLMGWPGRATATIGWVVMTSIGAHVHASAALSFAGVGWATPGTRIDLIALAATLGAIVLALVITLEAGRDRFLDEARDRGLPEEQLERAREIGDALKTDAVTTAAFATAVLALGLRIADTFVGGNSLPLPEVAALAVVLGLGAVLLGVRGREDLPG